MPATRKQAAAKQSAPLVSIPTVYRRRGPGGERIVEAMPGTVPQVADSTTVRTARSGARHAPYFRQDFRATGPAPRLDRATTALPEDSATRVSPALLSPSPSMEPSGPLQKVPEGIVNNDVMEATDAAHDQSHEISSPSMESSIKATERNEMKSTEEPKLNKTETLEHREDLPLPAIEVTEDGIANHDVALAPGQQSGGKQRSNHLRPCQLCKKKKKACDRQRPCQRCKDAGENCTDQGEGAVDRSKQVQKFTGDAIIGASKEAQLQQHFGEDRVGSIQPVERDVTSAKGPHNGKRSLATEASTITTVDTPEQPEPVGEPLNTESNTNEPAKGSTDVMTETVQPPDPDPGSLAGLENELEMDDDLGSDVYKDAEEFFAKRAEIEALYPNWYVVDEPPIDFSMFEDPITPSVLPYKSADPRQITWRQELAHNPDPFSGDLDTELRQKFPFSTFDRFEYETFARDALREQQRNSYDPKKRWTYTGPLVRHVEQKDKVNAGVDANKEVESNVQDDTAMEDTTIVEDETHEENDAISEGATNLEGETFVDDNSILGDDTNIEN